MAISMVGAAAIWRFVYRVPAGGRPRRSACSTRSWPSSATDPVNWLQLSQAKANSLLLMVILIWAQVGFSMVLLSAAVKSVPEDTIEAGPDRRGE